MKATYINITRYCTHDGPGIRSTLFLKGCPLHCIWCHNPESQKISPEIGFDKSRCTGCGRCKACCPACAVSLENGRRRTDKSRCIGCGKCADVCPAEAVTLYGKEITAEDALAELTRDKVFYETSGGGVTVSGGEPLMQSTFVAELFQRLKESGISTAVETCGFGSAGALEQILPYTDLVLFDIKETDEKKHLENTGVPLSPILKALKTTDDFGVSILLRAPIVPGYNDRPTHLRAIKDLSRTLRHCQGVELMPYHTLGSYKYAQLGREYSLADISAPTKDTVAQWEAVLKESVF